MPVHEAGLLRLSAAQHPIHPTKRLNRNQSFTRDGYSRVELMVTVAAFLLLTAVVMPSYLRARNSALMSSMISKGLGFAKACAIITTTGLGDRPATGAVDSLRGGVTITQGCSSQQENIGATLEVNWGLARAENIRCLDKLSTVESVKAILTVSTDGKISCDFLI
jgi:hypothetical protein